MFEDADCSTESFEGIRAQDIVPLLAHSFRFRFFLGFGNLIDPFVDRSFGPNFDPAAAWDREFIDRVHRRDEEEIAAGRLHPTHMLAVLGTRDVDTPVFGAQTPLRIPIGAGRGDPPPSEPIMSGYEWGSWPHAAGTQLQRVCGMLEDSENRLTKTQEELNNAIAVAQRMEIDFRERTEWALRLDAQLKQAVLSHNLHEEEIVELTTWARGLQKQLAETTAWALQLDNEFAERTAWALSLDREVADLRHRISIDSERLYLPAPHRCLRKLRAVFAGLRGRIRLGSRAENKVAG